jgi:hypothetical protein
VTETNGGPGLALMDQPNMAAQSTAVETRGEVLAVCFPVGTDLPLMCESGIIISGSQSRPQIKRKKDKIFNIRASFKKSFLKKQVTV